jgi:WXG100 family type VII secretion target
MSGGSTYAVDWNMQGDGAASVRSAVSSMESQLSSLESQVRAMYSTWDSDAQHAYSSRQTQWSTASDNIKTALTQWAGGLDSAADTASSTESTNTGVVA